MLLTKKSTSFGFSMYPGSMNYALSQNPKVRKPKPRFRYTKEASSQTKLKK